MTLKDDKDEVISKRVLDWLTGLITLAAALTTIFGVFTSEDKAKPLAFGMAFLLIFVSGVVFIYQRRRAAKLNIADSLEPLSATASLRGLLPFEEGDQLPGRARDIQELYTLIASSSFRFGVLWGESGCGKTSLMRAGLVPKMRNDKFLPLYINKPTNNPQEAIRSALIKEIPGLDTETNKSLNQLLKSSIPKGKKVAVLLDQFEEFFLTNRTPKSREIFIKWLGKFITDEESPAIFLIGIRSDFFAQLQNFAPYIPEPTSIRTTYQLQNFDTEQAKQIFNAAAKADGIPFEPALIQAVIKELEFEEFVRPAELQVVGTRLKRKNVFTLNKYEVLGGARGILSSYIGDEINQSMNQQAARLILRLMCADVVETKSQIDLSLDDILHGVTGTEQSNDAKISGHPEEIQAILNQFVAARVLIHTDEDKYNLAHDYLAPYVRTATEGVETNTERANRLLKRYVAEYNEDRKTRIPFGRTHWIERYASPEVKAGTKAQELIRKSKQTHYGIIVAVATPILVLIGLYFFFLTQSYYLSIDRSYIALRAGLPQFTFLPGFGDIAIQTDFKRENLAEEWVDDIDQEKVTGFWFNRTQHGYQRWGEDLVSRLEPISQAQMLRRLGQPSRAEKVLVETITNSKVDAGNRYKSVFALTALAQTNPQLITADTLQIVIDFLFDSRAQNDVQNNLSEFYSIAPVLVALGQAVPQAVTPTLLQSIIDKISNPLTDQNVAENAIGILDGLAQTNPQAVTPDMLPAMMTFLTNTKNSYFSFYAANLLRSLAQAAPESVTPDMFQKLMSIISDPQADTNLRSSAVNALGSFAQADSNIIPPNTLSVLLSLLTADNDTDIRNNASNSLFEIALNNPLKEGIIIEELEKMLDNPRPQWRMIASRTLEMIAIGDLVKEAQNHPDQIEHIKGILNSISNPYFEYSDGLDFAVSSAYTNIEKLKLNPRK